MLKNLTLTIAISFLLALVSTASFHFFKKERRQRVLLEETSRVDSLIANAGDQFENEPIIETVKWMMEQPTCKGSKSDGLSDTRKSFLSSQISTIVTRLGGTRKEQEAFIWLICKESQFRNNAKSPVGALGLTQMMIPTAQFTADQLKLGKLAPEDLFDSEISLTLGYTHFLYLSGQFDGNLAKISAAYNGGSAGATVKSFKTGGKGAHETDAYVASLYNTMEDLRIARQRKTAEH